MEKYSEIMKAAEKHNVEVYREMPDGWRVSAGALTAPRGAIWINNGKSLFKGERKAAFLVDFTALRWELEDALNALAEAEKATNEAEERYTCSPMDEIAEAAFDSAYEKEYSYYMAAVEYLMLLTGIDLKTAREMIQYKRDDILKIVA